MHFHIILKIINLFLFFSLNKIRMIKQIIAIGGGGFGRNPNHNKIERYILNQSEKENPNILFLPTASAEDKSYLVN